ncbi:YHS domain protein [Pseudovibrio sp. W64]|uniref:YHS domain-containing (seleno)protein n=1 Tax=unclassified Pseudovibrio TaxID=2627060 RepID=UPI00070A592F|nr:MULTISPECIES: YHS domain-containing (seleno)protein [unclassified Pseudovibrio]KZK79503.1 YHS domain protein [Pseudovibrio sp. W64]KZK81089.1 YHS domain protein [Pseudovibrio sp. Ad13]KZL00597.1 YHS domain protein [Pseudovibrio sp. W74]KZL05846.1 YHS domain protein [Pseudovibrio sp. Ad26]KZL06787.1 YHS domain protein [Pseudovibrio sp. Ad14]
MPIKSSVLAVGLALSALVTVPMTAMADDVTNFVEEGYAIKGTDPVAYFTQGKPVPGKKEYSTQYQDVTWLFSSAENLDKFKKDPTKYAPQYGGWCATGVSFGVKIPIQPEQWKIVDGKLYLNAHAGAQRHFLKDPNASIARANENWPTIIHTPEADL